MSSYPKDWNAPTSLQRESSKWGTPIKMPYNIKDKSSIKMHKGKDSVQKHSAVSGRLLGQPKIIYFFQYSRDLG